MIPARSGRQGSMTISTSTSPSPDFSSANFGGDSARLKAACSRSQFTELAEFAFQTGITPNGAQILLHGTTVSPGVGELRGAIGALTFSQLPWSVGHLGGEPFLRAARAIESAADGARLVVEPSFYRGTVQELRAAPHGLIRSAAFRLIDGDKEVFRAELRPGGRRHRATLKTLAFDGQFHGLAHDLISENIGRGLELRDFDRDFLAAASRGLPEGVSLRERAAPALEIDLTRFGQSHRSYSTPQRTQDLASNLSRAARMLADRLSARSAISDKYEMLGAAAGNVVVLMYPWAKSPITDLHNFLDGFAGIYSGKIERHPPHNLWVGLRIPEMTNRAFFKTAQTLESPEQNLRFELRDIRPRLSFEEFMSLRQFPEAIFHSPESSVRIGRSISALQDSRGFFVQFNPNAPRLEKTPSQDVIFFNDRHSGEAALNECHLILGGDDHPNLANRKAIFSLPSGNKIDRICALIQATLGK